MTNDKANEIQVSELAQRYARLFYLVQLEQDECGGEPCFVARHPELMGCMADGRTEAEAIANLAPVRAEFIQVLLDAGAEVPVPAPTISALGLMHTAHIVALPRVFVTPQNIRIPTSDPAFIHNAPFAYEKVA